MVPFMEQKRAMGKLNSVSYNPPPPPPPPPPQPQINQESQVNLPLAPIISTPPDRRGNTAFSTHQGSTIFSPTQTLDQPKDLDPDPPQHHPPPQHDPPDGTSIIKYVECLRNHAASVGRHVLDGCGEFMPNGEEGTLQSLHCAACDCHRSFHRRETSHHYTYINPNPNPNSINNNNRNYNTPIGVQNNSSSEDVKVLRSNGSKKRFRTKFSQQQKDRMQEFATRLGWKMQKQDEQELQKFCSELGVKRQVYKVWMHNNKQAMKKRSQIM